MKTSLIYIELFQFSIILFISAILTTFVINMIFTQIDKKIEENKDSCGSALYYTQIIFALFFQLFIMAVVYYLITEFIRKIPSFSYILNKKFSHHKTINYTLHIILIILMIELNPSLKHNLFVIAYLLDIGHYEYKCSKYKELNV